MFRIRRTRRKDIRSTLAARSTTTTTTTPCSTPTGTPFPCTPPPPLAPLAALTGFSKGSQQHSSSVRRGENVKESQRELLGDWQRSVRAAVVCDLTFRWFRMFFSPFFFFFVMWKIDMYLLLSFSLFLGFLPSLPTPTPGYAAGATRIQGFHSTSFHPPHPRFPTLLYTTQQTYLSTYGPLVYLSACKTLMEFPS